MRYTDNTEHLIHVTDGEAIFPPEVLTSALIDVIERDLGESISEITVNNSAAEINPASGLNAFCGGGGGGNSGGGGGGGGRSRSRSRSRSRAAARSRSRANKRAASRSRVAARSQTRANKRAAARSRVAARARTRANKRAAARSRVAARARTRAAARRKAIAQRKAVAKNKAIARRSRTVARAQSRARSRALNIERRSVQRNAKNALNRARRANNAVRNAARIANLRAKFSKNPVIQARAKALSAQAKARQSTYNQQKNSYASVKSITRNTATWSAHKQAIAKAKSEAAARSAASAQARRARANAVVAQARYVAATAALANAKSAKNLDQRAVFRAAELESRKAYAAYKQKQAFAAFRTAELASRKAYSSYKSTTGKATFQAAEMKSRAARSAFPSRTASYESYRQSQALSALKDTYQKTGIAGPTKEAAQLADQYAKNASPSSAPPPTNAPTRTARASQIFTGISSLESTAHLLGRSQATRILSRANPLHASRINSIFNAKSISVAQTAVSSQAKSGRALSYGVTGGKALGRISGIGTVGIVGFETGREYKNTQSTVKAAGTFAAEAADAGAGIGLVTGGALFGATVGSAFPVVGTAVGGAVGAAGGALVYAGVSIAASKQVQTAKKYVKSGTEYALRQTGNAAVSVTGKAYSAAKSAKSYVSNLFSKSQPKPVTRNIVKSSSISLNASRPISAPKPTSRWSSSFNRASRWFSGGK